MILADSSVWIAHLRATDETLLAILHSEQILCHPVVIGELAVGNLADRAVFLDQMSLLPTTIVATHDEALALLENNRLFGKGIGYQDIQLLASVRLTPSSRLWTRDRRLHEAARTLDLAAVLDH